MSEILSLQSGIQTVTGNAGGAVEPDENGDLGLTGTAPVTVTGDPTSNSLVISVAGSVAISFPTDSGTAVPALGALTVAGGTNVGTTGAGSTVTVNLDADLTGISSITTSTGGSLRTGTTAGNTTLLQAYDNTGAAYSTFGTLTAGLTPTFDLATGTTINSSYIYRVGGTDVAVADGGTGLSTITDHGIMVGQGAASPTTKVLTDGQVLIGSTGIDPVAATLTQGTGISITNAAGSVTVATTASVPTTFASDSGNAVPALNTLTIAGGTNIGTTGAGSTITANLDADLTGISSVTTSSGGSLRTGSTAGDTTLLQAYDNTGAAYSTFATLTAGVTPTMDLATGVTIGTNYIYRAGGTDITVTDGGTGNSSNTAYAVICGGTTATGNLQSIAGVGTSGQVLTSNGAGALPTFQDNPADGIVTLDSDSGSATGSTVTIAGGTNIGTTGAGSTITANLDADLTGISSVTTSNGGSIRTGTTVADTTLLQAYDNTGASYTTFGTLTAGLTPTFDLATGTTINSSYIYRAGGTDVAVADGGTGLSTITDHGIMVGQGASSPTTKTLTNGQVLIGSTGADPVAATLTAGTGISIAGAAGSITISYAGATGFAWTTATADVTISANTGYVTKHATPATELVYTLPATGTVGDVFRIVGYTAGGWKIAQNAGQQIFFGSSATTIGATGYLEFTNAKDCVELVCVTTDTEWCVTSSIGNITVA